MKIYTKTGDTGKTSLFGGNRVAKDHIRLEAYGCIDELNSHVGLLRDYIKEMEEEKILFLIQGKLMIVASLLATEKEELLKKLTHIKEEDVTFLEDEIDRMEEHLPVLRNFILPGGHVSASHCHLARTVCRRAERRVISLNQEVEIYPLIIKYLNRLSDYLFTLSRLILHHFMVKEVEWKNES